ncbi:hypothetical protein HY498_04025 [Candidatus Woesearchaeota archaeon]|nr:hypothetical protein [Candidatus Woesearchaeota archaeon]
MVENKTNWNTVLIVLVIGVVGILLLSNSGILTGGAFSKDITGDATVTIRANSCDADSICEVAKTVSTMAGSTSALVLTSDVKKVIVDGSLSANSVYISGKTISTTPYSTSALVLTSDVKKVIVDSDLYVQKLAGNGSAYACLDSYGKLYRSSKTCI